MNIKLYEFIDKKNIDLCHLAFEIPVPTEFVITKTQICTPQMARVYRTSLYLLRDEIVDYNVLRKESDFKGTLHYDEILLVEVWVNCGDDGHTNYVHKGFRYIPQSIFEKEREYTISYYAGELPHCMHWVWEGEPYPVDQWEKDKKWKEDHE